jgi:general secretion pathway protein G
VSRLHSRHGHVRSGMTLLELLPVLAAIAIVAGVVGPNLFRNVGDAKTTSAKTQVDIFGTALGAYRLDNDRFPTTQQGLDALRSAPIENAKTWRGPYLTKLVPRDPWGREYVYVSPGIENPTSFDLYTLGRDGRIGGTDEDADITSWGGAVRR